jgi:hypothetical protein
MRVSPAGAVSWGLLAVACVAAATVLRATSPAVPEPTENGAIAPAAGQREARASHAKANAASSEGAAGASPSDEAMSPREWRNFHVRIGHEQCEDGIKRLNALEGRTATDPRGLTALSVCLRIGNLAWHECLLRATAPGEASVCSRRFLSLDNPP